MRTQQAANTVSTEHTGTKTFPANNNRTYFFVTMIDTIGSVSFGQGGGEIPIGVGGHYSPKVCPTGEIQVTCTGTYVVHMG